ncbi:oxidoreductase [Sphingomonas sp. IC-56]|uniref:oxidoreductase n=1 Tax=Sphingomonas sp. IC-56 TaxID=2898529 RepID=UPI001E63BB07|nr:oxidoreductase [Sphingomonas sp. IC-56]MCD2325486.1 oxidoreductase [Sphingomonas sp. IC-56]
MIRTGLIGFGLGGSAFHAPLIQAVEGLSLAAVATSRADAVRATYPEAAVSSAQAVIGDPEIELVVISTPNATHYALARDALEAGKHVVIDKPFAGSVAEAEALAELARAKGLLAIPFHNRRWDSDFQTVRRLIERGRLGEILLFEAHWDRFRPERSQPWKESAGAGQLADLGPHLVDQALLLFGEPDAVSGDLAAQREGSEVDDYFTVTLFYGERRVVLASSRMIAAPRPRFSIHGRGGSFVKFGLDPQEAAMRSGGRLEDAGHGVEDPANHGALTLPDGSREMVVSARGAYRCFYEGVVSAIAGGAAPPVSAEHAILGLRIIELARRSAAQGQRLAFA